MTFQNEERLLKRLKAKIAACPPSKKLAALDADGTLWPEDANDILLDYERREGLRDLDDLLDPYYQKEGNRHKLCALFAQRQAGWTKKELKFYCRAALRQSPLHVFPFQKKLLALMRREGFEICLVTASLQILVETAVELYDLPVDGVVGAETRREGDKIGSQLVQPLPAGKGKGQAFLKFRGGKSCFLAGGNTLTDLPLLEMAEISFAVHAARPGDAAFSSEAKLKSLALKRKWPVFEKSSKGLDSS